MFCPECGRALPDAAAHFCPFCGNRIVLPPEAQNTVQAPADTALTDAPKPAAAETPVTRSKCCSAALVLGAFCCVFGMLTLIGRMLAVDLRVLKILAAVTFFLAPLACVFGVAGIAARVKNRGKRGLASAIFGLLLGLAFGALAAYCLLTRILLY